MPVSPSLRTSDFDFALPAELIAQAPPAERGASRLLAVDRASGQLADRRFAELPALLGAGDLLVMNDSRVFPARLLGRRLPGGGGVECLLVRRLEADGDDPQRETWSALVHPGQRLRPGTALVFDGPHQQLRGEIVGRHFHGRRTVRLRTDDATSVRDAIHALGHVPLPPYIRRPDEGSDRERYQTVFARREGSVAAPTAGLHFTPEIVSALTAAGIQTATITLHVGYGTFQPVRTEFIADHRMDAEDYEVDQAAAAALTAARAAGRRIVAVGTTTTRTLESLATAPDGSIRAGRGSTDLFIAPGHRFRVVGGLVTNFHVPRSSLLMLVSAFAGVALTRRAYAHAVAERYRFYSYGDAMLIL
ncbi:MAG: tRNA preQ1(34) S-adenosylmethionine ribosyltransferase-isomerase QueA [Vicinamibacterales bacterium]